MMRFFLLTTSVLVLACGGALAQQKVAPSPETAAKQAEADAQAETTVETKVETKIDIPADPTATAAAGDWELCPEPDTALSQVPSEMDELQADIDRYTLCLNRAELLLKLNDLKNQNQDASVDAMSLPGSLTPTPLSAQQTAELMGGGAAGAAGTEGGLSALASNTPPVTGYGIRDIRGVGGMLTARLQSADGNFEQVKIGDRLTDGSEVTSITTTQVTISKDGSVKRLDWNN